MINSILFLLIVFQIKHLIVEFYLQTPYMYENKGNAIGWVKPLMAHAGMHAASTFIIIFIFTLIFINININGIQYHLFLLVGFSLFDGTTHFIIDRWKATLQYSTTESKFWTSLGIDQILHHIVGIIIIYFIAII